ncbi:MAG: alpha-hydroxy-acid oxidizing protein [Actinomycetota bacterium]|nr:alpha-hydroxy-acid oxidizing protein [Actinomycetota bacterium]MDH5224008.1 alpha-hydroxy-acid oxidizing protein [Actinomycetota bacterium]MDH5312327.1 alpha-hydroxy-acid oxidizing protein [Actinomycetota bacterium]
MSEPPRYVTVEDYLPVARAAVPPDVWDYYEGGAGDEWTLRENRRAFDRWVLRPRFLRSVGAHPDTSTSVLDVSVRSPVLVAPWAYQRLAHPDGELATARAAAAAGTVMIVSSTAESVLDEVQAEGGGPKWWQLYVAEDRAFTASMLERVVAAGYEAICWTVDFPVSGLRRRDTRSGFVMPLGVGDSDYIFDASISWDDLAWIKGRAAGLPVIVKGVLTAEDAELAVQAGADAIVVSNHGGRQLDRSPAGLEALPEVAAQVSGRVPVLMDGGVRRGTDVLIALALGASAVLVGRPTIWGLAAEGEAGVAGVLEILRLEFENAMALTGSRTVDEIGSALVRPAP